MRLKEMKENKVHSLKRKMMNKYNNKSSPSPSDRFFNTIRAVTNEQKLKLKKEVKSAFLLNSPITSPHLAKRKFSASRLGTAGVSTQASVLSLKLPSSISNGNLKVNKKYY